MPRSDQIKKAKERNTNDNYQLRVHSNTILNKHSINCAFWNQIRIKQHLRITFC